MNLDLTIVIPTYNEEKNIVACLEAIGDDLAKEIYLIDSNSTDQTVALAKNFNVEVINFIWNGKYPKKRNWFLKNFKIDSKWILFLDADEILTPRFKREIRDKIPKTSFSGFKLNYSNFFLGRRLKGGFKLKKLALFKFGYGFYEEIKENSWSNLDMEVHEHPIINGKVGNISSEIIHKDYKGLTRYIERHNQYSDWESWRFLNLIESDNSSKKSNLKKYIKYSLISNPFFGVLYFFCQYFIMSGWRDGLIGFYFALYKASYFIQVSSKIYANRNKKNSL